ncbi:MAG: type IV toxin-antitoxin system AbiEi family antitoxin [Halioglobus sp.]
MKEAEVLDQAIEAFGKETGLRLLVIQREVFLNGHYIDAEIELPEGGKRVFVEVKKWAQHANVGALVDQVKRLPGEGLLVADYVNPKMAKRLKDLKVQFIDAAGNAFVNQLPLYVYVTGKKQREDKKTRHEMTNRAFDVAGLKVIFGLLCDAELVDAPYRVIAEETGVALGTVGGIVNDLKDAGYILDRGGKRGRKLVNQRRLLDRWVEAYPEKLRPKLRVGDFINDDPYWWEDFHLEQFGAYWGGEVAAAKYVGYLKPEVITIYLPEHTGAQLMGKARLRKAVERTLDDPGIVRIYRPFWPGEKENKFRTVKGEQIVHPILIYADLLATGDGRNLETARIVYDKHIAEYIRED